VPPGRAETLKARKLELDRNRRLTGGRNQQPAVLGDCARRPLGCTLTRSSIKRRRPQPRGIGVEAEDELRPPLRDGRRKTVSECRQLVSDPSQPA
jgi:hypothetical protein